MSNWVIFHITLLNWKFLLKWYNFFWNFCWNRNFLLFTMISIDFNSQISFPLCQGVKVGNFGSSEMGIWNFGKVGVGVGYFTSDSTTLIARNWNFLVNLLQSTTNIFLPWNNKLNIWKRCWFSQKHNLMITALRRIFCVGKNTKQLIAILQSTYKTLMIQNARETLNCMCKHKTLFF